MSVTQSNKIFSAGIRFVALFFLFALVLTYLLRLSWMAERVIGPYTEFLAALVAHIFNIFGLAAQSYGTTLWYGTFGVEIRRGCDGIEATVLLVSACLAYPSTWTRRIWGILGGYGLIFILNLIRTVAVFQIGLKGSEQVFDFVHTYVAQFFIIAFTMVFWIFWTGRERAVRR